MTTFIALKGPGEGGMQRPAGTSIRDAFCGWEQMRQQSIDFHLVANPPVQVVCEQARARACKYS